MSRLLALGCVVAVALVAATSASAEAQSQTLLTDGAVTSIATSPSTVYLGGTFSRVSSNPIGEAATIDTTTGVASSTTAPVTGGVVTATAPDGSGGWFIGGTFTAVGGRPRTGLAHLLPDGSVDSAFDPTVTGTISALVVSGSTLYVGGAFTIGSQSDIAALDTSDAAPAGGVTVTANGPVDALLRAAGTVYMGGSFTSVDSVTHDGVAAINGADGTLVSPAFAPDVDIAASPNNTVDALALAGGVLYIGGSFSQVDGRPRVALAAVNTTNGNVFTPFSADITGGQIRALAVSGTSVYVGGQWSDAKGTHTLAALSTANGDLLNTFNVTLTGHDPLTAPSVSALRISGTTLYVGGYFSSVNSTARYNLAAVSSTSGALNASWHPDPGGPVDAIKLSGGQLEAGGDLRFLGGTPRHNLAAVSAVNGALITTFAPNLTGESITALLLSGGTLYAGGQFNAPGGRFNLAALSAATGALAPAFKPAVNGYINAMALSGATLYIAGGINSVDGAVRYNLAAVNATNGTLISGFAPTVGNLAAFVRALALDGGTLYFGGQFNGVDGDRTRSDLAAVRTSDGTLVTTFNPRPDGAVQAMLPSGAKLYAGGSFSSIGGAPASGLAALNAHSGAQLTSFRPAVNGSTLSLYLSGRTTLYAGGVFSRVDGKPRADLAALNAATGALSSQGTPGAVGVFVSSTLMDDGVYALGQSGATVYAGGPVLEFGSIQAGGFGSFAGTIPPKPPVNTARPVISGRLLPGHLAHCSTGRWINQPTHFAYQWNRRGHAIPGAQTSSYAVQIADEAQSLTCTVTAFNIAGSGPPTTSADAPVVHPGTLTCPQPSGQLTAHKLGPIALGMTRQQAHSKLQRHTSRGKNIDQLCLFGGWGIDVAYQNNKVVLALTSNPAYALRAIAPGASLTQAAADMKLGRAIHTHYGDFYLAHGHVLKVRARIVQEVGIAARQLTREQLQRFGAA